MSLKPHKPRKSIDPRLQVGKVVQLTAREQQVLELHDRGLTFGAISKLLGLNTRASSVYSTYNNAMAKLSLIEMREEMDRRTGSAGSTNLMNARRGSKSTYVTKPTGKLGD